MNIEYHNEETVAVLHPSTPLNAVTVDRLRDEWMNWFETHEAVKTVIIDFAHVEFLDSSGMGLLVALLKRTSGREGDIKITGLNKSVRMVFEITRMHKVFEIFDTVAEALADLA